MILNKFNFFRKSETLLKIFSNYKNLNYLCEFELNNSIKKDVFVRKFNKIYTNKMFLLENELKLSEQEKENIYLQRPSYLFVRKYEDKNEVYFRLFLKTHLIDNNISKTKFNTLNLLRKKDEKLSDFIEKLKISIVKITFSKKEKKKSTETKVCFPDVNFFLENQKLEITDLLLEDFISLKNLKLKIDDFDYNVVLNPPFVSEIFLPKIILKGFEIFPKLQVDFPNEFPINYEWFKIKSEIKNLNKLKHSDLVSLSNQNTYIPTKDDVNERIFLKITPRLSEYQFIEDFDSPIRNVSDAKDNYPFEYRHSFTKNYTSNDEIRIVCYNILADMYSDTRKAKDTLFNYCESLYLTMDYRKNLLIKEILGYNADLICLQEVDKVVFQKYLLPNIKLKTNSKLNGILALKNDIKEGCATFYNTEKFDLIENFDFLIRDLIEKDCFEKLKENINNNSQLKERFSKRNNVLQLSVLKNKFEENSVVLLFNTHLYFHPDSDHIRLIQGCLIHKEVKTQIEKYAKLFKIVTPIVSGDFNSCPEFGIYNLFTKGFVSKDFEDWKSCEGETIKNYDYVSELKFKSACGTPEYTNFTVGFKGCLDYIFYDPKTFEIKEIVPNIPHQEVISNQAIPNETIPSDHLAQVCTLKWIKT